MVWEMEELSFWVLVPLIIANPYFLLAPLARVPTSSQSITWNLFVPLYALGTQLNQTDSLTYKVDLHSLFRDTAL